MNLTINSTTFGVWKHVKIQYVAAICGLALAVSAAAIFSGVERNHSPRSPVGGTHTVVASSIPAPAVPSSVSYYVVDSQAMADTIADVESQDRSERARAGLQERPGQIVVLLAAEVGDVVALSAAIVSAAQESGISTLYEVVDLRGR
jgi:hypothetical protein